MPIPIWPTVMPCMAVPVVEFPTFELVLIFRNSKIFLCQYFLFLCHTCSIKLHSNWFSYSGSTYVWLDSLFILCIIIHGIIWDCVNSHLIKWKLHLCVLLKTVQISKHTFGSFDFLTFLLQTDSPFGYVLWMTIYTLVWSQIILGTEFSTRPPYGYRVHTANDIAHRIVLPSFMLNSSQNRNFYNWSCHNPCLQKTDSAIYIHDDHLYLERVAALTTISFKENGYQSCHVTKIKRVIHGWKWFVKTLNTDIKRLVVFFSQH